MKNFKLKLILLNKVWCVLQPKFEDNLLHNWSVGYRPNHGVQRALQIILWNIERGYNHIGLEIFGKPYAFIVHVRFDKGEALREVSFMVLEIIGGFLGYFRVRR